MTLAVFAYSRQGCRTARRAAACLPAQVCELYTVERLAGEEGFLPIPCPAGPFYGELFRRVQVLLFVGACGIAVRAIAPHVRDKRSDPAVLCVDETGRFVIPLLSGHLGGANDLARHLAAQLGAQAVVTTATDLHGRFSVDDWAAKNGFFVEDLTLAKAVSAAILEGEVPLCSDFPILTDYPPGVVPGEDGALGICLTWTTRAPFRQTLRLIPRVLHLGIGCRRGVPAEAVRRAVDAVFTAHALHPRAVRLAASIDLKAEEKGLLDFCAQRGLPLTCYSAARLGQVPGSVTPSAFVRSVTGVDNVCERAALLGAERLVVKKTPLDGVSVAVAAEKLEVRFA